MSKSGQEPADAKSGVSVSDMARTVGLSRQRFHQLMKSGVFPQPLRDEATGRPYYDESGQAQCLEVRRRNCGVNGRVVLFYARRQPATAPPPRPAKPRPAPTEKHDEILDGIRALGLVQATALQVNDAIKESFPKGTGGVAVGEVIRAVFLRLRQNTADKVG
ncbi:hypothetical protein GobsT_18200 [Gemmata obscuriglobus]|uniref:Uncharacterized protein n=1 Tax=Gemmata obscuriglobus TaxID=114 RepID=A0A2Z3H1B9_9BACT|nr:hypothetical protein [Gemmata obscuriglobus]AWM39813.1 hypothetical protein C1280_24265 [Gemmata obscuriglobus]QEG27067.1 hypothetical protein GobsT_18200 [Gemmata obscuriglobus]VTS03494.1 Uncharacterized protein OS=Planctomyces brasiliensis (strain ATCC 49424 / DSM 5305 / JCM 21570 / NBRC 103401 / IFAM 1448) GN=Plabr_1153 PE=4 SV=1 [Gemmata obscuriglobus UQM 2246]